MLLKNRKLGTEIKKEELGELAGCFEGKVRLLKIIYCFQDKNGTTAKISLGHKDYIEEEKEVGE